MEQIIKNNESVIIYFLLIIGLIVLVGVAHELITFTFTRLLGQSDVDLITPLYPTLHSKELLISANGGALI